MMDKKRVINPSIDDIGRYSIVEDLDKNLFVIAGAGSGKTSMLVSRMVAMVESGIDISKICAITFTKKAAAEFLSRFQAKLKERSKPPFKEGENYPGDLSTPTEITANRCRKALENIDLCFTGTIDSFCNLVLSEYPNNANIPSSSMVIEEDELASLYKKEYEKIANGPSSLIKDKLEIFNSLFRNGAETFSKSINDVMEVSYLNIVYPEPLVTLEDAVSDLANKYENIIHHDVQTLLKMKPFVNTSNQKCIDAFLELEKNKSLLLDKWTVANFIYVKNTIKKVFHEWLRFDDEPSSLMFFEFTTVNKTSYKCLDKNNSTSLKEYFDDVDKIIYSYAMDFLVDVSEIIKNNLRKQGKLSFTEYLMIFRNMIVKDMNNGMKLINHIRNKHSYFLIDESQDTSPAQTELFIYLTSKEPASTLENCKPIPGSLFIVGDPKQSIYGFRGADVNAYLHTKDLFDKVYDQKYNKVVYLTKNFRSNIELIRYFNDKFQSMENYETIPEVAKETPKEFSKDVIAGLYRCNGYLDAIKSLVGRYYIYDNKINNKRLIEYKDIMLLTWTTNNHDKILATLKDNDIPVYCEGRFTISGSDILSSIYSIYAYLAGEPGQFQNLLSSPLFNASPASLLGVSSIDDVPEGKEKDFLLSIESLRDIKDPVLLIENIVSSLKIYQHINYTNIEYALFVIEKLKEAYASLQVSDIRSGEKFLKDFISTKLDRCMNMELTPNAVNLANVHKVKGLEKPVVILAEAKTNAKKPTHDAYYSLNKAYIFKTSANEFNGVTSYDIQSGDLFSDKEEQALLKNKQEVERLGYVAVTRARNILIFPPYSTSSQNPWKEVQLEVISSLPHSSLPYPEVEVVGTLSFDNPSSFNNEETYWEKSPSKQTHIFGKLDDSEVEETQFENDIDVRTKGTLIHRMMEMIINSKGKLPKEVIIDSVLNEYSLDEEQSYRDILSRVYDTMFSGGYPQKNNAPQDLLKIAFNSTCACEVPFSFKEGKMVWQGIIDLLYINDGKYYIVDYKTNADDDNLEEEYKRQLEAYKKSLKKSLGVDVEAFIYHIETI